MRRAAAWGRMLSHMGDLIMDYEKYIAQNLDRIPAEDKRG